MRCACRLANERTGMGLNADRSALDRRSILWWICRPCCVLNLEHSCMKTKLIADSYADYRARDCGVVPAKPAPALDVVELDADLAAAIAAAPEVVEADSTAERKAFADDFLWAQIAAKVCI